MCVSVPVCSKTLPVFRAYGYENEVLSVFYYHCHS